MSNQDMSNHGMENHGMSIENTSNQKYEFATEKSVIRAPNGTVLRPIRALVNIGDDVEAGDIGGYIEKESNLSTTGMCWVYDKAMVYGNAVVAENAKVMDAAQVRGNARIIGSAIVYEDAEITDNVVIEGNARVFGDDYLEGDLTLP